MEIEKMTMTEKLIVVRRMIELGEIEYCHRWNGTANLSNAIIGDNKIIIS
jgi:hypothetical protein